MATGDPLSSASSSASATSPHSSTELFELRRDLAAAALVQQSLLPVSPIRIDNYRIDYELLPAGKLAGDFVAVAQWPEGDFAFVVADVAGHGTASALVTVLIKSFMSRLPTTSLTEPTQILHSFNTELLALGAQRHICMLCGLVTTEHLLKLAGAGVYPLPLLTQHANQVPSTRSVALSGKALGLFAELECSQVQFQLQPADRLTVVTDGVLQLMSGESLKAKEAALVQAAEQSGAEAFFRSLSIAAPASGPDDTTWFALERLS